MGNNVVEHWEDDDSQMQSMSGNESAMSQQEVDSDADSMVDAKHKEPSMSMNWYAYLKMLNIVLYLTTLCLVFGYFTTTKYESKFVYYMFQGFVICRPALIMLYSIIMIMLEMRRRSSLKTMKKKNKKKERGEYDRDQSNEDISENQEPSSWSQNSQSAEESDVSVGGSTFKLPGQEQYFGHPHQNKVQNFDSGRNT